MREKFQMVLAAAAVLLLLPYVITNLASRQAKETYAVSKATKDYISISIDGEIREVSFEDYVCGVAAAQIEGSYELEALKAQMVIARTNLEKFQEDHPGTLLSEKYKTLGELQELGIMDIMVRAAEETKGQVLTFKGGLVRVPFHAVSSGSTRSGEGAGLGAQYPWLTSAASGQDVESEWYLSVKLIDPQKVKESIEKEYPGIFKEESIMDQIRLSARDGSDYVTEVEIGGQKIAGEKIRMLLDLPSSCFFMEEVQGKIRITTKGLGHGLGMSQYGANAMAKSGANYQEILQYYFEKCIIA